MIRPDQVFLAVEPIDMRMGADGLSLLVQQSLGSTPGSGHAFAFRNRRGNRMKLLVWDGTGVWLCQRRLHQGKFIWPKADDALWQISAGRRTCCSHTKPHRHRQSQRFGTYAMVERNA